MWYLPTQWTVHALGAISATRRLSKPGPTFCVVGRLRLRNSELSTKAKEICVCQHDIYVCQKPNPNKRCLMEEERRVDCFSSVVSNCENLSKVSKAIV
jgi:hypothetical protein